ncbi:hypothetical protein GF324_14205 [bacterium]|nr:hypothetical protein [bacterium]
MTSGAAPPVVVYQMGKVGSSSLARSLAEHLPHRKVYQVHHLSYDRIGRFVVQHYPRMHPHILESLEVRRLMEQLKSHSSNGTPDPPLKIISAVRDPVARNVSAFFENLQSFAPEEMRQIRQGTVRPGHLRTAFLERYPHDLPITWFSMEPARVLDTDPLKYSFDRQQGVQHLKGPWFDLQILRLENADTWPEQVQTFLGCEPFRIAGSNLGSRKYYSEAYQVFKQQAALPADYLDRLYDAPATRHFYTPDEIQRFRARWSS